MAHYPCEFYAKYLLALDRNTAMQRLANVGYNYQADHLDSLVQQISPIPEITSPLSVECVEWAQAQQIHGLLVRPNSAEMRDMLRIFQNHTHRQLLESLLTMNLFPKDVTRLFTAGSGVALTEGVMKRYQHYFWNTRIMSRLDWFTFLFDTVGGQRFDRYADAGNLWAYIHLPARLAIHKAGFSTFAKIDKSKALDDLFNTAYLKAMEEAQTGNVQSFQKASMVAIAAFDAAKTTSSDINDVLSRLTDSVRFVSTAFEVETIASVSGGHHSAGGNVLSLSARGRVTNDAGKPEGG